MPDLAYGALAPLDGTRVPWPAADRGSSRGGVRRSGRKTMKNVTFTTIVERDPESGWLVSDVAELPGCYTQAATFYRRRNRPKAVILSLDNPCWAANRLSSFRRN